MRRIRIKGVNDMKEYAFGIDLGGTTAKVGLFTTSGKLLEKWEVSTDTSNNGAHILENLAAAVQQKMQEKGLSADEIEGVGLGVPGPVLDSSIVPIVCANHILSRTVFRSRDESSPFHIERKREKVPFLGLQLQITRDTLECSLLVFIYKNRIDSFFYKQPIRQRFIIFCSSPIQLI